MKAYPKYKSSGIDWLGEIPSHWRCVKIKNVVSCNDEVLSENTDKDRQIEYVEISDVTYEKGITGSSKFLFKDAPSRARRITQKGDVIISTVRTYLKAIARIVDTNPIVSTGFAVIRPLGVDPSFLFYAISSNGFLNEVQKYSTGVSYPAITSQELINLRCALPPIEEQKAIAGYLDEVTAKIDTLMAEKRAQVEDLRKYRTSLITETVTRGLNPNVPIKQTNSEWFPNIPTNWSIEKFKYQATVKANLVHPTDYIQHPQISPDSIEKNTGRLLGYKSVEEAGIISDNHLFYKGQIIYSKIRPNLNKVIIAPFNGLCSADMYPIETLNNVRYFQYLMLSNPFVSQVSVVIQDRVKMPKINQVELGEILILVPPIFEQQQIADYLDEKTAKIDSLVEELEAQIGDLATYRQAVITEAVTGKIDVREWSNPSKN